MREIKFRAWDNENKKWVYGWFTKLVEGIRKFSAIIQDEDGELIRYYIHDEDSIGQYTGCTDNNGKEIYEGDIIKAYNFTQQKYVKGRIEWNSNIWGFSFVGDSVDCSLYNLRKCCDGLSVKVIGNIMESYEDEEKTA